MARFGPAVWVAFSGPVGGTGSAARGEPDSRSPLREFADPEFHFLKSGSLKSSAYCKPPDQCGKWVSPGRGRGGLKERSHSLLTP